MPEGSAAGRGQVEAEAAGRGALLSRQRRELRQPIRSLEEEDMNTSAAAMLSATSAPFRCQKY
eukprot:6179223-Pleurochrysis_carterae.AAC.4